MGDVDTAAAGLRLQPDEHAPGPPARAWAHRRSADELDFPRTSWGHRGYDEDAVRGFAEEMLGVLEAAEREMADLRTEIDRLHRYIRRQWAATDGGQELADPGGTGPSAAHARMVIAQADELADRRAADGRRRLSDAEDEVRRRVAGAARQAELRLEEADRLAAERLARAEEVAANRLASADAMAEEVLAEARRRAALRTIRARDESGRVVVRARERFEQLVREAHSRAAEAAAAELAGTSDVTVEGRLRSAYLHAYGDVGEAAREAVLRHGGREFDRLLQLAEGDPVREAVQAPTLARGLTAGTTPDSAAPAPAGTTPDPPARVLPTPPSSPPPPRAAIHLVSTATHEGHPVVSG